MTYQEKKTLIIYLCVFIFGVNLITVVLGFKEAYSTTEINVCIVLGAALILGAAAASIRKLHLIFRGERKLTGEDMAADADEDDYDLLTSRFLGRYGDFWNSGSVYENMPVQNELTQLFYNMILLNRRRLERLNIRQKFIAAKRKYADIAPDKQTFSDGNYSVTQMSLQIEALRNYYISGGSEPFYVKHDKELARFSILSAEKAGETEIKCPNCGCITTREKLLDGCDYCNTRFVVEDLQDKVSGFALRDDADLAYAKYKEKRIDRAFYAFYAAFAVMFLIIFLMMLVIIFDPAESFTSDGEYTSPLFLAFSLAGVTGAFAAMAAGICELVYLFVIVPIHEISAAAVHSYKKKAELLKLSACSDAGIEAKVREFDPLFSIRVFYLNIQNKISSVIYSDNAEQINAFMEKDHSELLQSFDKAFDYDVISLELKNYEHGDALQRAKVEAQINCSEICSGRFGKCGHRENAMVIRMNLIKSAECKTQIPGSPYVMRCGNCGDSLSLADGMICPSCGTKADLKKFDWVIEDITVE